LYIRRCGLPSREEYDNGAGLKLPEENVNCSFMNDGSVPCDVAVIGGGPAGLSTAIALARSGARIALIARRTPYADNRTTALLGASVDFLQELDVWPRCADKAAALKTMRLVDDTGRLIRAPEVRFCADEIGLEAFGYNIENRELIACLEARAAELANLVRLDDEAESVEAGISHSGSPAFRRRSSYLAMSSGRRNVNIRLRSETRNAGSISRSRAMDLRA